MKCGNCGGKMEKVRYDLGFGVFVDSYTCSNCRHNFTEEKVLDEAVMKMRERIAIRVKILKIGSGVGIRIPNEVASRLKLKTGKEVEIIPGEDQIIVKETK